MYKLIVEGNFSSAHNLRGYQGKCEDLHGHNWKVQVSIASAKLDKAGMVMDFKVIKKQLFAVLEGLDHKYLNGLPYFKKVNPTSENNARYLYNMLHPRMKGLVSVTVWENDTSCAVYEK
ncbi:MAG: 6-carboxytetrahydropterin synthase QueD [Candidatus Omnitrophica bacterium]|nr:6-carboxytetrahydropterin synthase QueD [Candidatus Omnitrophota bacterium]